MNDTLDQNGSLETLTSQNVFRSIPVWCSCLNLTGQTAGL